MITIENLIPMLIQSNFQNLNHKDTGGGKDGNNPGKWVELEHLQQIIQDANTPDISKDSLSLNEVVAGVPNIWARVLMFKYAIQAEINPEYGDQLQDKDGGAFQYFENLITEWRALLGLLALHSDRLSKETITLSFSEKEPIGKDAYEMKGVAGNVLFDSNVFWRSFEWSEELKNWIYAKNKNDKHVYKIQAIFYSPPGQKTNKYLVGATSPFSLVFTPARTDHLRNVIIEGIYKNGWKDPTTQVIHENDKDKIFFYLEYIKKNLREYANFIYSHLNRDAIDYRDTFDVQVRKLKDAIESYLKDLNHTPKDLNQKTSSVLKFDPPFHFPLNSKVKFHFVREKLKKGKFILELKEKLKQPLFDEIIPVSDLFISNKAPLLWFKPASGNGAYYDPCAYLLKVNIGTEDIPDYIFVAPPLSNTGIRVFHETGKFDTLFDTKSTENALTAVVNDNNEISITLKFRLFENEESPDEGVELKHCVVYNLAKAEAVEHTGTTNGLAVWPDIWNNKPELEPDEYYFYSEFPQTGIGFKAVPLIMANFGEDFQDAIPFKESNNGYLPYFKDNDFLEINIESDEPELSKWNGVSLKSYEHIKGPGIHNYEIYESKFPFIGAKITYGQKNVVAGYIMAKAKWEVSEGPSKSPAMGSLIIKELPSGGNPVNLSIDFGSNNTCIGVKIDDDIKFLNIKPRIKYLFGEKQPTEKFSERNIIFFPGESIDGLIKSHLQLLSDQRLETNEKDNLVFIPHNVPVKIKKESNPYTNNNYLQTSINNYLLRTNMKWDDELTRGSQNNTSLDAYLKHLRKLIKFELRVNKIIPGKFFAAYPASLDQFRLASFKQSLLENFGNMGFSNNDNDKKGKRLLTESEAVANFLTAKTIATENEIHIGIDIGGSTTDFLFYFLKEDETGKPKKVLIQESVELGGNYLVEFARTDENEIQKLNDAFNKVMSNYFKDNDLAFSSSNLFYTFNRALDLLYKQNQLNQFYLGLSAKESKSLLLTLYMGGAILYYAGIFLKYIIKKELNGDAAQSSNKTKVSINVFGKGGNIFAWGLKTLSADVNAYYKKCLSLNAIDSLEFIGDPSILFDIDHYNNKKEIAHGLLNSSINIDEIQPRVSIAGESLFISKNKLDKDDYIFISPYEKCETDFFYNLNHLEFQSENLNNFLELYSELLNNFRGRSDISEKLRSTNQYWNVNPKNKQITLQKSEFLGSISNMLSYKNAPRENEEAFDFNSSVFMLEILFVMNGLFR